MGKGLTWGCKFLYCCVMERTDNLNIVQFKPLITPEELKIEFPETFFEALRLLRDIKSQRPVKASFRSVSNTSGVKKEISEELSEGLF